MPFKTILTELVEAVPGANGAILADWEGEAVAQFAHYDEYDLKVLGAHNGILLNLIKEAHQQFSASGVQELIIGTEKCTVLVGVIGPDYSLVMTIAPDSILGQALYRFRAAMDRLHKEIY